MRKTTWFKKSIITIFSYTSLCAFAQGEFSNESVERRLDIRYAEEIGETGRLRVSARYTELQDQLRYPISTLDMAAFKMIIEGSADTLSPVSLSTSATVTPAPERALLLGIEQARDMGEVASKVRQNAAEFLGGVRANFFSVLAFHGAGVEPLAESIPGQAENIKVIQKRIIDSSSLWETGDVVQGVCAAPRQFESWREMVKSPSSQRAAVLVSRASGEALNSARLLACLKNLAGMGVQTFWIRLGTKELPLEPLPSEVASAFFDTGGYVHSLAFDGDMLGALSNVRSQLDDEYVVEFQLPETLRRSASLSFVLQTSYHGNLSKSEPQNIRIAAIADPALAAKARQDARKNVAMIVLVLGVLGFLSALGYVFVLKRKYIVCSVCGFEVRKNYSDCPFKSSKCLARLVVISGTDAGRVFPLFENENILGKAASSAVRLTSEQVRKKHAKITLYKKKALYQKIEGVDDRINGWPVGEPRLLGHGALIHLGDTRLRFECKE